MNNAVYSKTIKKLRNRVEVRLVKHRKRLFEIDIQTKLRSTKMFHDNLVEIHKIKTTLIFTKPEHVGMCILGLTKVPIYECHYD